MTLHPVHFLTHLSPQHAFRFQNYLLSASCHRIHCGRACCCLSQSAGEQDSACAAVARLPPHGSLILSCFHACVTSHRGDLWIVGEVLFHQFLVSQGADATSLVMSELDAMEVDLSNR